MAVICSESLFIRVSGPFPLSLSYCVHHGSFLSNHFQHLFMCYNYFPSGWCSPLFTMSTFRRPPETESIALCSTSPNLFRGTQNSQITPKRAQVHPHQLWQISDPSYELIKDLFLLFLCRFFTQTENHQLLHIILNIYNVPLAPPGEWTDLLLFVKISSGNGRLQRLRL